MTLDKRAQESAMKLGITGADYELGYTAGVIDALRIVQSELEKHNKRLQPFYGIHAVDVLKITEAVLGE